MSYWLAPSLVTLRSELNAAYPNRDKRSDGWIGDKAHAATKSGHNPSNWPPSWTGVVTAYDVDNDISVGVTGQTLVDLLVPQLGIHPALGSGAYLIYNSRIISTDRLREGWRKYTGKNPHEGHVHISVGTSAAAINSEAAWGLLTGADDIMQNTEEQYQIFMTFLYRALRWDVRKDGAGPTHLNGPTLWERLAAIESGVKNINASSDPVVIADAIAEAIPDALAAEVVAELAERLKGASA